MGQIEPSKWDAVRNTHSQYQCIWLQVPAPLTVIASCAHAPWEEVRSGSTSWILGTHAGDLDGAIGCQLLPLPAPAVVGIGEEPADEKFFVSFSHFLCLSNEYT